MIHWASRDGPSGIKCLKCLAKVCQLAPVRVAHLAECTPIGRLGLLLARGGLARVDGARCRHAAATVGCWRLRFGSLAGLRAGGPGCQDHLHQQNGARQNYPPWHPAHPGGAAVAGSNRRVSNCNQLCCHARRSRRRDARTSAPAGPNALTPQASMGRIRVCSDAPVRAIWLVQQMLTRSK